MRLPRLLLLAAIPVVIVGCGRIESTASANARIMTGGDPERGRRLLSEYGCVACHQIPGVPNAVGTVGPPLDAVARRSYLGGRIVNTPENMIRWISDPRAVDRETAMPALAVSQDDVRDIATYLYTLH